MLGRFCLNKNIGHQKEESIARMVIKKHGMKIKKMVYELENKVVVDSKKVHNNLIMADSRSATDPLVYHKYANYISLIKGLPTYFALDLNLPMLIEDPTNVFPIKNKIYDLPLLNFVTKKQSLYGTEK